MLHVLLPHPPQVSVLNLQPKTLRTSVIELPLLLGDLLSIMHSYGFCFEAQKTIFNLSWSVLPESNANDNLKTLRTFARNFPNIDFFLKMLPLKDDELVMSETQKR